MKEQILAAVLKKHMAGKKPAPTDASMAATPTVDEKQKEKTSDLAPNLDMSKEESPAHEATESPKEEMDEELLKALMQGMSEHDMGIAGSKDPMKTSLADKVALLVAKMKGDKHKVV